MDINKAYTLASGSTIRIRNIISDIDKIKSTLDQLVASGLDDDDVFENIIGELAIKLSSLKHESRDTISEIIKLIKDGNTNVKDTPEYLRVIMSISPHS